ncbi:hypothetical protein [Arthrobacter sp. AG367]|uniref:hypothetical protein n=1 Tax=Arthrobacter sp. AG367 TaxID=2572909 RepID=UPI0011A18F7E|nr:hypothetical protein [Arthrobacter sp. AG367]
MQGDAPKAQLAQEKAETSRLRMMWIRAEVVIAANSVLDAALNNAKAIELAEPVLARAIARWRIDSQDDALVQKLLSWPRFICSLAWSYRWGRGPLKVKEGCRPGL